ncbi:MAG: adenylate/guanylate cyclase protein [Ramlibacter sp.]|nr:adenylate/guanylate cyclase protein [Ramlibacter sp.]
MECQACHTANPESNRFCESCGEALPLKCAACGFHCTAAARFCGGCGTPLGGEAAASAAARPVPAAPSPALGWGELKQATVLFADIVSSTEQIAQLDPEQAMDRLQPAVTLMCESIERFGGTVIRTLGDGVMAAFGVPKALEGHARLACESALQMQAAFARNPQGLSIRVGLHSGLVASDPHAHDGGKGGGAHGLTIHLASRVVAVALPGDVTMTHDCHSLVRGLVDVESMGQPALKGIREAVEIFRLAGLKPAFASQHFHQARLTPFRGRNKELILLQQAQRLTEAGDAQVMGVSGGPGSGKSRLCYEFAQWCRARGRPVFEVRAQLYGSATPLQPVLELMRVFFFGISESDAPAVARSKIALRLGSLDAGESGDHALVSEFLGVPDERSATLAGMSPKARRSRLLAIVTALVKHAADTVAVVLIEDMHWLDNASEEFVAAMVKAIASTKTMVVLNYRSSYRSPWAAFDNFREIELGELSPGDTAAIVRELISHRREFQDISQLIVKRSGGNPFFAEELVRSLAERGMLSADAPLGSSGLDSVAHALPATVQAVIAARIDRLGEAEKSLLQMCAIIGKEVPSAVLERVAGPLWTQVKGALDALCESELIQVQPSPGVPGFSFRHPLIQEVAYSMQLKARRAAIHASVASAMEHHYADQLDEYSALISHHYEAAGHPVRAAGYSVRAARWLGSTNSAQSIEHWRRVRVLLDAAPRSEDSDRVRVLACGKIAWLGWREGLPMAEVMPFIQAAKDIAGDADSRIVRLMLFLEGRMLQANGASIDRYIALVQEALASFEPGAGEGSKVLLNTALCQAYGWAGMLSAALAASDAALAGVDSLDEFEEDFIGFSLKQWALVMRGRLLAKLGRLDEATECLEYIVQLEARTVDPVLMQIAHFGLTEAACSRGNTDLAQRHRDVVVDIAEKQSNSYLRVFAFACKGLVSSTQGQFGRAVNELRDALLLVRRDNVAKEFEAELLTSLAEAHHGLADSASAEQFSREAIALSRERNNRHQEIRALRAASAVLNARAGQDSAKEAALLQQTADALIRSIEFHVAPQGGAREHRSPEAAQLPLSAGSM